MPTISTSFFLYVTFWISSKYLFSLLRTWLSIRVEGAAHVGMSISPFDICVSVYAVGTVHKCKPVLLRIPSRLLRIQQYLHRTFHTIYKRQSACRRAVK